MRADLHLHSRFSDGSDSVEILAQKIIEGGFSAVALTDHDTDLGNAPLAALLPKDIRFIPGIEFTCTMPLGRCHILGYGFDGAHPAIREAIEEGKRRRRRKLDYRLALLEENHGITLTEEEKAPLYETMTAAGKPHIAAILVKRGLAGSISEAIKRYMSHGKSRSEDRLPADYAVKAILESGGIPVWAHPLGGEGEVHLEKDELCARLDYLMEAGIRGLECHYSRYTSEETALLLHLAEKHSLLVSGGSDYHGENKDIPLGRLSADGETVQAQALSILA